MNKSSCLIRVDKGQKGTYVSVTPSPGEIVKLEAGDKILRRKVAEHISRFFGVTTEKMESMIMWDKIKILG